MVLGFVSWLAQQKSQDAQEAKQRALEKGLKDEQGNQLISSDAFRQHLLVNEEGYQIIYQEKGDFFLISISGSPFNEVRQRAEQRFLSLTAAPPKVACELNVKIVTPQWANPNFSEQTFSLSFCQE